MKKLSLSAVSILVFSISGLLFGQTNNINPENTLPPGKVIEDKDSRQVIKDNKEDAKEDIKSDNINKSDADQTKEKDLSGKDKPVIPANDPVKDSVGAEKTRGIKDTKDISADKADKTKTEKTDKSESDKKIEQKQITNIKNIPEKPAGAGNGLLEIEDGDFKYKRIPGISFKKEKVIEYTPINPDEKESYPGENGKGLLGLKKSTSDILIKILLACLIIGIIILFKVRSKRHGDDKVLKRFPGA